MWKPKSFFTFFTFTVIFFPSSVSCLAFHVELIPEMKSILVPRNEIVWFCQDSIAMTERPSSGRSVLVVLSSSYCLPLLNHNADATTVGNMELGGSDLLDELQQPGNLLVPVGQLEEGDGQ